MMHYHSMIASLLAAMALSGCMVEPVTVTGPVIPPSLDRTTRVLIEDSNASGTTRTETVRDAAGNVIASTVTRVLPAPTVNSLLGQWSAGENRQRDCKITLSERADLISGGRQASDFGCMGKLFPLAAWVLAGETLVLKDSFGGTIASLKQTENRAWAGDGIRLWR